MSHPTFPTSHILMLFFEDEYKLKNDKVFTWKALRLMAKKDVTLLAKVSQPGGSIETAVEFMQKRLKEGNENRDELEEVDMEDKEEEEDKDKEEDKEEDTEDKDKEEGMEVDKGEGAAQGGAADDGTADTAAQ